MNTVSPMTLGTVQLGMNYGIANRAGKPAEETSFAILKTALEGGVTALDTAAAYGDSEAVIGRFLKQWTGKKPAIITKVPPLQGSTPEELKDFALRSVEGSLQRLGIDKADTILLHGAKDPILHGQACADAMQALLDRGYTDRVGVSVYTAEDIEGMLAHGIFSATQIPMSIIDQRLILDGSLERLRQKGYTVFVRSVFTQGLFFLDPDQMDDPLLVQYAAPKIRRLRALAAELNLTVAQLAIAFIRDCCGVTSLALGADTPAQVQENLSYFDTPTLEETVLSRLYREFSDVNMDKIMKVLSRPKK
ncbi:MAG: aldo/keto reductase [Clostridia bacterium]|nr:aldo/keto reductase [Clostridia bacterium]